MEILLKWENVLVTNAVLSTQNTKTHKRFSWIVGLCGDVTVSDWFLTEGQTMDCVLKLSLGNTKIEYF